MKIAELPKQNKIEKIFNKQNIVFAALFGSRAKRKNHRKSDYDFLVEFDNKDKYSLLDLVALKNKLENILGKDVDLVTIQGLNPKIAAEIQKSQKVIYDRR